MTYAIRPMDPQDFPACLELWGDVDGIVLREESDSPEAPARFLERNPGLSFVAVDQGMVVGSILCGHDGRRAHLYHLAVRTEQRRTRCATALLEAAI